MKKWLTICLALLLFSLPVLAAPASVDDQVGMLSEEGFDRITRTISSIERATDYHFYLAAVDFTDGRNLSEYADSLLRSKPSPESSALLLMVVGEDTYILKTGRMVQEAVHQDAFERVLAMKFRPLFEKRQYEQGVRQALLSWARLLEKARGVSIDTSALEDQTERQPVRPRPARTPYVEQPDAPVQQEREEDHRGWSGTVFIVVMLYWIFGKKRKDKDGCGCGTILLILFILSALGFINMR